MAKITIGRILSSAADSIKAIVRAGAKGLTAEADITSTSIDADHQALDVAVKAEAYAFTANRTTVLASSTDVLLLAPNVNRTGAFIYNNSNSTLYIGFGDVEVSNSTYTTIISSNSEKDVFFRFTGEIRGFWAVASGDARITELTL